MNRATSWIASLRFAGLPAVALLTLSCDKKADSSPQALHAKEDGPRQEVPTGKVLDSVVLKDLHFTGEGMDEAIALVQKALDAYCEKEGVLAVTIQPAVSKHTMSFGGTAMTARMVLKMIASETRGELVIDVNGRKISFDGVDIRPPRRPGDPIPLDLRTTSGRLYSIRLAMEHGNNLAPYLDKPVAAKALKRLAVASEEILRIDENLTAEVDELKRQFRARFDALEEPADLEVKVAPRGQAITDARPPQISIATQEGTITISKSGGTEPYHACLMTPVKEGPSMILRFRLTKRGRGGTPVPYFGVRSSGGTEAVLCNISSSPKPDVMQEIYLFRNSSEFVVLFNGAVITKRSRAFKSEIYAFFHMNDESEVVLEEVLVPNE